MSRWRSSPQEAAMTCIDCCNPFQPAPPPSRGGRIRRFTRRLGSVLVPVLVVAALGCREDAESPTAPEPGPALDVTPTDALVFRQVSAGTFHTCGVTPYDRAYCWGHNFDGQLGNGTNTGPEICEEFPCSTKPVAVVGRLRFRQVTAGGDHTCGVTTGGQVYCWGFNAAGQLGTGTNTGPETCFSGRACSTRPVAVAGGLHFSRLNAGGSHTCGVTADNRAHCWGSNFFGQLGDGTITFRHMPVAVAGGLQLTSVAAGERHTCGRTPNDIAYCWGENDAGQLGNGSRSGPESCNTLPCSTRPVRVVGGLRFRQIGAGGFHSCGRTPANLAYCWGRNFEGQLGDGSTTLRIRPVAVAGGRRFSNLSTGNVHTCAVTPFDVAFCWGANNFGQLGDNTSTQRLIPVRTHAGGLRFRQVTAGGDHTCGVTTSDLAYCWGRNREGQLGDGTITQRRRPSPVVGAS
jgi:alpha-tubulin suppressor-like RCC1 family protein